MPELPRGTVAFLFTDLEGSTRLWRDFPAAMPAAYARHDAVVRDAVAAHGGVVYKVVGDAFQAAFTSAPAALNAALQAQRALVAEPWQETALPEPLRVRMALHAGAVDPDPDGDYRSPVLNRLGRLLSAGHGGQVLVSQVAFELARDHLPAGAALRDLGEHALKDLWRPERIWQLLHPDLPEHFPALATLDRRPHNLPLQPTPLIGREREIAEIVALLHQQGARLVTLTGPGGTGKTRLALQTAADLLDDFPDGVWFIDLAAIRDPSLVAPLIADTLGVREDGGQPLTGALVERLRDKRLLLVLDNFEQVTDAAALVQQILAGCPGIRILVTSRTPLRLRGEREVAVPPLALPDPRRLPNLDQFSQYEAVRLFIARTRDVKPDFAVDSANAWAVAEICHRLDGLPLAIELAAARVKMLPPEALLRRLDQRLPLLVSTIRDVPGRQRTLTEAIAWSYDLLSPEEQSLFRRLAVFAGGFTLEAAEAVANPDGALDAFSGVASLLDKSLLRQIEGAGGEPRFVMLETIREFGLEQLAARGEEAATRDAHAAYFANLAERLDGAAAVGDHALDQIFTHLEAEHANFEFALAWLETTGSTEAVLLLASALHDYWLVRGYAAQARQRLERALALGANAPAAIRAAALASLSGVLFHTPHEEVPAIAAGEEAIALAEATGSVSVVIEAAEWCGLSAYRLGQPERAEAFFARAVEVLATLPPTRRQEQSVAHFDNLFGYAALARGDLEAADIRFHAALARHRDTEPGQRPYPFICYPLAGLGDVARGRQEHPVALAFYRECLEHAQHFGDVRAQALSLVGVAGTLAAVGRWTEAAPLFGATEALCERTGFPFQEHPFLWQRALGLPEPWQRGDAPFGAGERLRAAAQARSNAPLPPIPDPETAAGLWAAGRTMPTDAAIADALAVNLVVPAAPVVLAAAETAPAPQEGLDRLDLTRRDLGR